MKMTTTINIEELYYFLDKIQECIKEARSSKNSNNSIRFSVKTGEAIAINYTINDLHLISFKQYIYIDECISKLIDIDSDVLGNFDNFK